MNSAPARQEDDTAIDEFHREMIENMDNHFLHDDLRDSSSDDSTSNDIRGSNQILQVERFGQENLRNKPLSACTRGISKCCCGVVKYIGKNKLACFLFSQFIFVFLKLTGTNPELIFWLTFLPTITILFACLCHFCIAAHRERDESRQFTNLLRNRMRRNANERFMEQLVLHTLRHRLQVVLADHRGALRRLNFQMHPGNAIPMIAPQDIIQQIMMEFHLQGGQGQANQLRGLSEEQINQLPVEIYNMTPGINDQESCSICIDEFQNEQSLKKLPCAHKFHIKCIDEWLKISNSCPNCKAEIQRNPANNEEHGVNININNDNIHFFMEEP